MTSVCWFTTSGLREAVVFGLITSGMPVIMVNTERAVGTVGTKKLVKRILSLAIASNCGVASSRLPNTPALNAANDSRWITTRLYLTAGRFRGVTNRAKTRFCGSGALTPRSDAI